MEKKTSDGRLPKFNEESSFITITLPRRIVQKLEFVDIDRAKAIVDALTVQLTWFGWMEIGLR